MMEGGLGSLRRIRYVESSGHKGRKGREREANDENVKHNGAVRACQWSAWEEPCVVCVVT